MNKETDLLGKLDELIKLVEQPGAVVPKEQCDAIIQEVNKQWDTADTEPKRAVLLQVLDATYNVLEATMSGEDIRGFAEYRDKLYKTLLLSEVMIGENVSTARLVAVTEREVASGRMKENHTLRQLAVTASAAPYLSDEELYQMAEVGKVKSTKFLEGIKSFFK
jgi:hypothetical protein